MPGAVAPTKPFEFDFPALQLLEIGANLGPTLDCSSWNLPSIRTILSSRSDPLLALAHNARHIGSGLERWTFRLSNDPGFTLPHSFWDRFPRLEELACNIGSKWSISWGRPAAGTPQGSSEGSMLEIDASKPGMSLTALLILDVLRQPVRNVPIIGITYCVSDWNEVPQFLRHAHLLPSIEVEARRRNVWLVNDLGQEYSNWRRIKGYNDAK